MGIETLGWLILGLAAGGAVAFFVIRPRIREAEERTRQTAEAELATLSERLHGREEQLHQAKEDLTAAQAELTALRCETDPANRTAISRRGEEHPDPGTGAG